MIRFSMMMYNKVDSEFNFGLIMSLRRNFLSFWTFPMFTMLFIKSQRFTVTNKKHKQIRKFKPRVTRPHNLLNHLEKPTYSSHQMLKWTL